MTNIISVASPLAACPMSSRCNDSFDDDQERALADYQELSLQLQFNERSRKNERGK
jgi:hypothetical protein